MSKEFMNVCAYERNRINGRIEATDKVLELYRQLWKIYREMEECSEHAATWKACRSFIENTVSPALKKEMEDYRAYLENITSAQQIGCMEAANG